MAYFDANGVNTFLSSGTTQNVSVAVAANSNRVLVVFIFGYSARFDWTFGATYNGVSLTSIADAVVNDGTGDRHFKIAYIVAPATGSNTLQFTGLANAQNYTWGYYSLYNLSQTQVDGIVASGTTNSTSVSAAVTPTKDGCVVIGAYFNPQKANSDTYSINGNIAGQGSNTDCLVIGDTGVVSPASQKTATKTYTVAADVNVYAISIAALNAFTRTQSDSISRGASRGITVVRSFGGTRTFADSILNGASRFATVVKVKGFIRTLSDSIMVGASRLTRLYSAFVIWVRPTKATTVWTDPNKSSTSETNINKSTSPVFTNIQKS